MPLVSAYILISNDETECNYPKWPYDVTPLPPILGLYLEKTKKCWSALKRFSKILIGSVRKLYKFSFIHIWWIKLVWSCFHSPEDQIEASTENLRYVQILCWDYKFNSSKYDFNQHRWTFMVIKCYCWENASGYQDYQNTEPRMTLYKGSWMFWYVSCDTFFSVRKVWKKIACLLVLHWLSF